MLNVIRRPAYVGISSPSLLPFWTNECLIELYQAIVLLGHLICRLAVLKVWLLSPYDSLRAVRAANPNKHVTHDAHPMAQGFNEKQKICFVWRLLLFHQQSARFPLIGKTQRYRRIGSAITTIRLGFLYYNGKANYPVRNSRKEKGRKEGRREGGREGRKEGRNSGLMRTYFKQNIWRGVRSNGVVHSCNKAFSSSYCSVLINPICISFSLSHTLPAVLFLFLIFLLFLLLFYYFFIIFFWEGEVSQEHSLTVSRLNRKIRIHLFIQ